MQYLDLLGLQQLWTSAKAKFASKGTLAKSGITDGYSSIETGPVIPIRDLENGILADIITGSDNHKIKTLYITVDTTGGLATTSYVDTKVGAVKVPAYTLTKSTSTDYAAVYHLQKNGTNVGEAINIPKDMVVESGKVVWGSYADGTFTPATDKKSATPYVELTLANSSANKIYIAVADLVNEHKAGTGISITNNTDGTRTIGLNNEYHKKIDESKTNLEALTKRVDGIVATGGEANQDAYSNIKVGSTILAATSKTDTVAFAGGTNISVAGSTAGGNKSVSFSHAVPTGAAAKTAGFYKFATDSTGHATGLTAVAASDITALIGAHRLTLSKTNAEKDTATITIGSTSYTVGPIPLGDETNPAEGTVRYILNR